MIFGMKKKSLGTIYQADAEPKEFVMSNNNAEKALNHKLIDKKKK